MDELVDWVVRCQRGESAAVDWVARRAADSALRTAAVAMGDLHAAADVSQETAIRVLRGIGDLRDPSRFDGWVYRITVSEVRRAYGRRRRAGEVKLDDPASGALACADGVERLHDAKAARAELREALASLPLRQRTAIALRYVHDLSDLEVARAMRCRPGTARSLLSRGLRALGKQPGLGDWRPPPNPAEEAVHEH
jgi:RNA polymerase sigma-70 factor (ECF subfamily)